MHRARRGYPSSAVESARSVDEQPLAPSFAHAHSMRMVEIIGWFSSIVLVLTIGKQVHKQWRAGTSEGVSKWLFVGQLTASLGFTVYSVLIRNWVFVVTNALMLANAMTGFLVVQYHRRREKRGGRQEVHA